MGILSLGKDYQTTLLKALQANREEGSFCDVEIVVDGDTIYAHKAILAACSPFFRTMFHSNFREGNQIMTVTDLTQTFPDIEAADRVITSFYTGQISIDETNMCETYGVCSYLVCDQTRDMVMKFMKDHLNVETAMAIWCVTDNPDDMGGQLHQDALEIVKNRFHDYMIFQADTLELMSEAQLKSFIQAGVFAFCSPKQKLTYLLRWLLLHGSEKTQTFISSFQLLEFPRVSDPSETLAVIKNFLTAEGFDADCTNKIVTVVEKKTTKVSVVNGNVRKVSVASTQEPDLPDDWEPNDNWSLDVLSHHLPNIPVTGSNEDALIIISPRYREIENSSDTDTEENEIENLQPSPQLTISAYLLKSKIWLDMGHADIPTDDSGIPVDVCKFEVIVCRDFLYLHNNGRDMYRLSLVSKEWEIINPTYADEGKLYGIFTTEVGGAIFFIIIRDIETHAMFSYPWNNTKIKWNISTVVSLWTVDPEDDSLTELMDCPDELIPDNGVTFGPCFNHDGFIFLRMKTDAMSVEQHGCLKFDPVKTEVTFEPFVTGIDRCQSGAWGFMKTDRPPAMDSTLTVTKGDWVYLFSKEKNIFQRMKQEEEEWHLEKEDISFPDDFYRTTTHAFNLTLRQSLPVYVDVPLGTSLFRFVNTDNRNIRGKLLEVNIAKPNVLIEHTPPSCDAIIGASYVAFQVKSGTPLTMTRYEHMDINDKKYFNQDAVSLYTKSHAQLPR